MMSSQIFGEREGKSTLAVASEPIVNSVRKSFLAKENLDRFTYREKIFVGQ